MLNPRFPWLVILVSFNIIGALVIYESGELLGDLAGTPLHSRTDLFYATLLAILPIIVFLGPLFNFITGVKVRKASWIAEEVVIGSAMGLFLLLLQISFLVFTLTFGLNIAGTVKSAAPSLFSVFFVLVPPEALFLIYYGTYRNDKYFLSNLIVCLGSSVLRGWTGFLLTAFFLEWCHYCYLTRNVNVFRLLPVGLAIVMAYPVISSFKWLIRSFGAYDYDLMAVIEMVSDDISSASYFESLEVGVTHVVSRIQSVSTLVETIWLSDVLQSRFLEGDFAPFWKEGLHGVIYDRLFGVDQILLSSAFPLYVNSSFNFEIGGWNMSPGYASWFFIAPNLIFIYIIYSLILAFLSHYLFSITGSSPLIKDVLWYVWFAYLLAPWFNMFVGFIYALGVFIFLQYIFSKFAIRRIYE